MAQILFNLSENGVFYMSEQLRQAALDFHEFPIPGKIAVTPNKVVFTHKPYPELKSAFYIKGFENEGEVGDLFTFSGWNGEKYYDQFDYVSWFNKK